MDDVATVINREIYLKTTFSMELLIWEQLSGCGGSVKNLFASSKLALPL
jgi:hypothetical protein